MTSYTDDNTPYTFSSELDATLKTLKKCTIKISELFRKNRFKSNIDKCNLVTNTKSEEEIQIGETSLASVNKVKLHGIHVYK